MTMYYLVNSHNTSQNVTAVMGGKSASRFNAFTGDEEPIVFTANGNDVVINTTICANGSTILFVYDEDTKKPAQNPDTVLTPIAFNSQWQFIADDNALTLDYCDLYFDGLLAHKNIPVSDVQEKAIAIGKKIDTKIVFKFNVKDKSFSKLDLVVETPEIFNVTINGISIDKTVTGYYHDKSFKTINIIDYVRAGENEIVLQCGFVQSEQVYENAKKSLKFESEKNKLTYDMEIEAIYLKGDFAVQTDCDFKQLERNAVRTSRDFYITSLPNSLRSGNIIEQGFPFFAGSITFKQTITLTDCECKKRSIKFTKLPSTVTTVKVNGIKAGKIMWQPYELDVSNLLHDGENKIEITVTGNLRNLLGPFHLKEGESHWVAPKCFFHESPIWCGGVNPNWNDDYCFVEFGLFF